LFLNITQANPSKTLPSFVVPIPIFNNYSGGIKGVSPLRFLKPKSIFYLTLKLMITVHTDGSTRGKNKIGITKFVGLGVYSKELNIKISKLVPGLSSNEAEFLALIEGMKKVIDLKIKRAIFKLDSEIIYRRAIGKKPKMKKHQNQRMDYFQNIVLGLAEKFEEISFEWIPREQNKEADYLAKSATFSNL
jgi:ribonuclease HI